MQLILFAAIFFFSLLSLASGSLQLITDQLRSSKAMSLEFKLDVLKISLKPGFHFNEKAPNRLMVDGQPVKPESISASQMQFASLGKNWKSAQASIYVCDDAVTYCETHKVSLQSGKEAIALKKSVSMSKPKKSVVNAHGFIQQDFQRALDQAQKEKKLILVDFGARWCPGCVRLENEILNQKFFKKEAKNFVKVKIDTDLFENVVLTEKFKIYGIPTLMVVNTDQKEISRIVDFQPENVVKSFFQEASAHPIPFEDLKKQAESDNSVRLLLGRRLLLAMDHKAAYEALKDLKPQPSELAFAEIEMKREQLKKDVRFQSDFEKTLKYWIAEEPKSSRSIGWRKDLVEQLKDDKEKEKMVAEGAKLADELLQNPDELKKAVQTDLVGEFTDFEAFWVAILKADLVEAGRGEVAGAAAWAEATAVAEKLGIHPKQKGPALRYLLIVQSSKNYEKADQFSVAMLKLDPKNWDVARRRLRILVELKRYDEAIKLGEVVIKNSFDRNQFWVAEVLSKAYVLAEKKDKALGLINDYLNRPEASWDHMKSSRKKLEDLRASLVNPASAVTK